MVFLTAAIKAQELNCQVSIITEAKLEVNSTEQEALTQLKQTVIDLMNNTQWTKDKFKIEERINCNIQFQINCGQVIKEERKNISRKAMVLDILHLMRIHLIQVLFRQDTIKTGQKF